MKTAKQNKRKSNFFNPYLPKYKLEKYQSLRNKIEKK